MTRNLSILLATTIISATSASAATVGHTFTGVTTMNMVAAGPFTTEFPVGTRWTVRVEWDSAAAYTGLYPNQSTFALTKFTTTLAGKSGTWTSSSLPGKAKFSLNEYGGTDEIQFTSGWGPETQTNPVIENLAPYSINVTLKDPTGTAITSLSTTPTAVDLTKWSESEFKIYLNNEGSSRIYGSVDMGSTVKVPEIGVSLDGRNLTDGISTAKFAKTKVGATAKTRKFIIRNTGGAVLTGIGVSISGAAKGDFKITKTAKSKLVPDGSTAFEVVFKPKKKGKRNAEIRVTSNDPDEKTFNIKLKGEGK
jgi:hypothetical protein